MTDEHFGISVVEYMAAGEAAFGSGSVGRGVGGLGGAELLVFAGQIQ
jgi:hypothetical protein